MEWIKLSETQPDDIMDIIFVSDYEYVGTWYPGAKAVIGNRPGCYEDEINKKEITLWMPFPKKPIE